MRWEPDNTFGMTAIPTWEYDQMLAELRDLRQLVKEITTELNHASELMGQAATFLKGGQS